MRTQKNKSKTGHQRHLRAGRISEPMACYEITKCVDGRKQVLANDASAKLILSCYDWLRQQNHIKLLAFCVMPDHYHVLFVLLYGKSLKEVIESASKFTATKINELIHSKGQFWQDSFHDHRCRDVDDALDRLTYIEQNPLRAGFVSDPTEWPYSSAFPGNAQFLDRTWYAERC
jgi:putative transposase